MKDITFMGTVSINAEPQVFLTTAQLEKFREHYAGMWDVLVEVAKRDPQFKVPGNDNG